MVLRQDEQEVAATLEILLRYMNSKDSWTCCFSEVFRSPMIRDGLGHPIQNKRQITAFCIPYYKEGNITRDRPHWVLKVTCSTPGNIALAHALGN